MSFTRKGMLRDPRAVGFASSSFFEHCECEGSERGAKSFLPLLSVPFSALSQSSYPIRCRYRSLALDTLRYNILKSLWVFSNATFRAWNFFKPVITRAGYEERKSNKQQTISRQTNGSNRPAFYNGLRALSRRNWAGPTLLSPFIFIRLRWKSRKKAEW